MTRIAVISDTHFPSHGRTLPATCLAAIEGADLLIHAGDLADAATLTMLRRLGPPLLAVFGNADDADVRDDLPASVEHEIDGLRLAIVHNGGPEAGRLQRLAKRFPEADVVIFGHSHIPLLAREPSGLTILNPGSATDRRRQPLHSMAEIHVSSGQSPEVTFRGLDGPGGPLPEELIRSVG